MQGFLPASSVVETEHIPYLLTEKGSLVFTIAPNGHVWGHRVEEGGTKRDIELEVYNPIHGGYTVRFKGGHASSWGYENDLTEGQKRATRYILAQKALRGVLGCLVLNESSYNFLKVRYSERNPTPFGERCRTLQTMGNDFENLILGDCLLQNQVSHQGLFSIKYLDEEFVFEMSRGSGREASVILLSKQDGEGCGFGKAKTHDFITLHKQGYRFVNAGCIQFPHYVVFAAQAKDKKFFVGHFPACVERHLFPNEITVLCDTENVFDVFQIDDALLLLEEKRISENESELYWTVAVAKNKKVAELARVLSNNPKALVV